MQQTNTPPDNHAWYLEVLLAKLGSAQEGEYFDVDGAFNLRIHGPKLHFLAIQQLVDCLGLGPMNSARDSVEMRLRLALHLAPAEAIHYDGKAPKSRKRYISEHLIERFSYPEAAAVEVSRYVSSILDRWEADRRSVVSYRDRILREQEFLCAACHLDFSSPTRVDEEEQRALSDDDDAFKPYFDGVGAIEWMTPEVDHRTAISKDGSNVSNNLQVLCRLCNRGKGSGGAVTAESELEYCAKEIRDIPRSFRMRILFNRLRIDGYSCQKCGSTREELTIRKVHPKGLYTLSNLFAICHKCVSE